MSARERIYNHIFKNGLREYTLQEIENAGLVSDNTRVLRQLTQDNIIKYSYNNGFYNVTEINNYTSKTSRSDLTDKIKYAISNRDGHRCQACGNGAKDNVKLHIDHKIPIDMGGTNNESNLWTLCAKCNQGKKSYFKDDMNSEVMTKVFSNNSGHLRLKTLFIESPNIKFSPTILQGISGIRDWTRTIREIRNSSGIEIVFRKGDIEFPDGYYIYDKK
ncbi:HNH endonuclease [Shewanella sp. UCD-KL12]|uniref:HNH endonuclease n=1 Tax=Shewanella sp. UCD-KL12 TaxID=1917163 RepID=UPI000970E857|nr:HNH endonuclease [Shewanella sp. UCD-KL12]